MSIYRISDIFKGQAGVGDTVTVEGWVRTRRDSKAGLSFLQIHDGSCFDTIQAVAENTLENYASEVTHLSTGCSVRATGTLVESQGKGQSVEIQATGIEVVGMIENPESYPVSPKRHTMEFLRSVAHLRPRTNTFGAMSRVRHALSQSIHRFFDENGFFWVHTPIITGSDCEGAGEMFRVSTLDAVNPAKTEDGAVDYSKDFFGRETNLTVSGQLALETHACALGRVYTFGPTFRAENSNTSRHLAEFWMVEPEVAFADLDENARLAEAMLKYIFKDLLDKRDDDMAFFNQHVDKGCIARLENFVEASFEQMNYTDAIALLEKAQDNGKTFDFPVKWGMDLQSEHERYLTEELIGRPVVVKNYPKDIKAFYMRLNDDEKTVAAMDVLAPGIGEIIGGAQREERLNVLNRRMADMDLDPADYDWYADLRRYGTVPHAGFGLGLERTICYATGIQNVRDVIPFPRTPGHAAF